MAVYIAIECDGCGERLPGESFAQGELKRIRLGEMRDAAEALR